MNDSQRPKVGMVSSNSTRKDNSVTTVDLEKRIADLRVSFAHLEGEIKRIDEKQQEGQKRLVLYEEQSRINFVEGRESIRRAHKEREDGDDKINSRINTIVHELSEEINLLKDKISSNWLSAAKIVIVSLFMGAIGFFFRGVKWGNG